MKKTIALLATALLLTGLHRAEACRSMDWEELVNFEQPGVPPGLFAKIYHGVPITVEDVATLDRAHVRTGSIINYLYTYGRHFRLNEDQIAGLRAEHVSTDLIAYMLSPESGPSFSFF